MNNFRSVGPLYCETPQVPGDYIYEGISVFPLEPLNAYTSLVAFVLGVIALYMLHCRKQLLTPITIMAVATVMVGAGSTLWHGLRTPLTLALDSLPGVVAFLTLVFLWPTYLMNRWFGYASIAFIFGAIFILEYLFGRVITFWMPLFVSVGVFVTVMVYITYKKHGKLALLALFGMLFAIIAATARSVDLTFCPQFPIGTHIFWHIFLGLAAFISVLVLSEIYRNRLNNKNEKY